VANVTYIGADGALLAFDTGPGNALLDDWMMEKSGQKYDEDGKGARAGKADAAIVQQLLSHPFFNVRPPKSLDRNAFASSLVEGLSLEDGAATLADFTVQGVVRSLDFLPEKPKTWMVSGGGRLNAFFMDALKKNLNADVVSIDSLVLNGDAIEAEAFAYLAVRHVRGLPLSFPGTTGVAQPMTGGRLHPRTA
jgi:anhydro-N-acetylmuramic acid kinase